MTIHQHPGQLILTTGDQQLASLHYLTIAPNVWVIEQLFVRPGQPVHLADQLLAEFEQLALTAKVTVKLLDPYAKRYFTDHPASAILAPHQLPVRGATAVQPVALQSNHEEKE